MKQAFAGFPDGTFQFLAEIASNNEKGWFDAHRADYQRYYVEPALALVTDLGPRLQSISSSIHWEPKIGGPLSRINRDIRFSPDKTPYKTHLDLWFWTGERRGWDSPGLFFRMFCDGLMLGAGMHQFGKPLLEAYRQAVVDPVAGSELSAVVRQVGALGPYETGGASRKSVPRGYDPGHERADLLRHEGLWAGLEVPIPEEAHPEAFIDYCFGHFRALWPLNAWLLGLVGSSGS